MTTTRPMSSENDFRYWTKRPTILEEVTVEYSPSGTVGAERPSGLYRYLNCDQATTLWDRWQRRSLAAGVGKELAGPRGQHLR